MSLSMCILSGAWGISLMFKNIKNYESRKYGDVRKRFSLRVFLEMFERIGIGISSIRFRMFVTFSLLIIIPLIIMTNMVNYYYKQNMISSQVAVLQVNAAVMADEFGDYNSLAQAENGGVYTQMRRYSTMNSVRVRIVNTNFVIVSDSYSMENDKAILNEHVIDAYQKGKSYSYFDSDNKNIEAVVPIYGSDNGMMGILVADMDVSIIGEFVSDVRERENVLITGFIIIIVSAIFIICVYSGRKVKKAMKVVEDVAAGHFDKRIDVGGTTELRSFAQNFNIILDKMNDNDENRQEFVSNVSHELKTPITSIKVLADSLNMQDDVPIELYKEFMQDITKEIDRESKIIEDLLSLVRMDKAADSMHVASVNINELLEMILKRLKPIAQKKNVEVLFESFRPVVAQVDELKFTQVISNLVENAIKYNKFDGWVHVSLNADYQYFYVRIEDSGIGIPEDSQDKVFERFYRVDKARSRESGGTGLGLAIVQKIIVMHHGTIKLHSEEGVGTTFTIRIPLNYIN